MKYIARVLLSLLSMSYVSCSSSGDDPSKYLYVDLGKSSSILIPAPATTRSCEQEATGIVGAGSITGAYFTLPTPVIAWTETAEPDLSEIRIVVLKLEINSPKVGGEYSCLITDLALANLFYKQTITSEGIVATVWDGKLGKNSAGNVNSTASLTKSLPNSCDLKCGGLTIAKGSGQFSVTGTWELIAVQRKFQSTTSAEYEEFPIKVTGTFTVDNTLN